MFGPYERAVQHITNCIGDAYPEARKIRPSSVPIDTEISLAMAGLALADVLEDGGKVKTVPYPLNWSHPAVLELGRLMNEAPSADEARRIHDTTIAALIYGKPSRVDAYKTGLFE